MRLKLNNNQAHSNSLDIVTSSIGHNAHFTVKIQQKSQVKTWLVQGSFNHSILCKFIQAFIFI